MRTSKNSSLLIYFAFALLMTMTNLSSCCCSSNSSNDNDKLGCKPSEREALLKFKHSVTFLDEQVSSSWKGEDCCSWRRVKCDPTTAHVSQLHLQGHCYDDDGDCKHLFEEGKMDSMQYLVELKELEYLDVSGNHFNYSRIPKIIGSLKQLRYLNLSFNDFLGQVPLELGNLTNLQVLDLSYVNLSQAHDWMDSLIGPLPSLRILFLNACDLPIYPTHSKVWNSSLPLHSLDLSENDLVGELPHFIQNLTSLEYLDLSWNKFESQIPLSLGKLESLVVLNVKENAFTGVEGGNIWGVVRSLCRLKVLNLSFNELQGNLLEPRDNLSINDCSHFDLESLDLSENRFISGSIPSWLGEEFRGLKFLNLGMNNISGEIPTSLGRLAALEVLDISSNSLEAAVLTESHFANLSNLNEMHMDQTYLTLKLPFNWVSPFQLQVLKASTCKINGEFPQWLKTQNRLSTLDLSYANIHGVLPKWFHKMKSIRKVDLSHNNISGCPIFPINFEDFDLSHNSISCPFHLSNDTYRNVINYNRARSIDLSNNIITGQLPTYLNYTMPNLQSLLLSNNRIQGSIPMSIMCHFLSLSVLALQKNGISGVIPNCKGNSTSLGILNLSFNNLSGYIPCMETLYGLHLNENWLSGHIPSCLANSSGLDVLDIGENELSGEIPTWFSGESLPLLKILRLRNNKLKGNVPRELCSLSNLQIMDLAHNYLTGIVPYCLNNLSSMVHPPDDFSSFDEDGAVNEVILGIEREYTTTLGYLVSIDLSCNNLVGSIPDEITNLQLLLSLNLSYNQLTGLIPHDIGNMTSLVSLDFSCNKLHGMIPTSMADIYSLEHLNLSYNNFSGQIPTGFQLQTLNDPSIYAGNPYLCGDPLPNKCKINKEEPKGLKDDDDNLDEEHEDKHERMWFYIVVTSGFATGFWAVVGTLVLNKSWRHALFRRVEDTQDWLYVATVVRMTKLKKKWGGSSDGSNISG